MLSVGMLVGVFLQSYMLSSWPVSYSDHRELKLHYDSTTHVSPMLGVGTVSSDLHLKLTSHILFREEEREVGISKVHLDHIQPRINVPCTCSHAW